MTATVRCKFAFVPLPWGTFLLFCFVKDYYLRLKSLKFLVCALTHEKFSVIISVGLKILRRNSTVGRLDSDLQL